MITNPKIIIYGAGAIGSTLAAWLSVNNKNTYLLCRGEAAKKIKADGLRIYTAPEPNSAIEKNSGKTISINVIESIDEVENPDIIALAVKNYSLPEIVKSLQGKVNKGTIILGLQNGVKNQESLTPTLSKGEGADVLFGVLAYNSWIDKPGVVGFQHKGVLVIGSPNKDKVDVLKSTKTIFNKGIETFIAKDWKNVSHTKLLINLGNSITTLLGPNFKRTNRPDLLQKIISNTMLEGIQILKSAGIKEEKIKGLPSWMLLTASAKLPQFITAPLFRKNLKKMGMSSMAQDVFKRNNNDSELDDINGHLLALAEKFKVDAPYNTAIYNMCHKNFRQTAFNGLNVEEIWAQLNCS